MLPLVQLEHPHLVVCLPVRTGSCRTPEPWWQNHEFTSDAEASNKYALILRKVLE